MKLNNFIAHFSLHLLPPFFCDGTWCKLYQLHHNVFVSPCLLLETPMDSACLSGSNSRSFVASVGTEAQCVPWTQLTLSLVQLMGKPKTQKWMQRPKRSIPYAPIIFQNKILEINQCWPGLVNDHRLPCVGRPAVVLGPSTARRNVCRQNSPASFTNQIMWWENIGRTYVLCPQQPAWERPRGCVHCAYCRPCF